jgi:hypothetical protein
VAEGGLELAAVDLDFTGAALLPRFGPRAMRTSPHAAGRRGVVAVDWQDLQLSSDRGHLSQFSTADAASAGWLLASSRSCRPG